MVVAAATTTTVGGVSYRKRVRRDDRKDPNIRMARSARLASRVNNATNTTADQTSVGSTMSTTVAAAAVGPSQPGSAVSASRQKSDDISSPRPDQGPREAGCGQASEPMPLQYGLASLGTAGPRRRYATFTHRR
jgi:hypothetical protein